MKKSKKMPTVLLKKRHFKQELKASCVAAAARTLLDFHGIADVAEAELRRILKTKPEKGTNFFNLLFLKDEKHWNLDVEIEAGNPNELFTKISTTQIPVIVFVDTALLPYWNEPTAHVVIVVGFDEETVIINDPFFDDKEIRIPALDFLKAWGVNQNYMAVVKKRKE